MALRGIGSCFRPCRMAQIPKADNLLLPRLSAAELAELARMLLARKLMDDDRRGTLSPMINALLAQSIVLNDRIPVLLGNWLPLLKDQFRQDMADTDADPSLGRFLGGLPSDAARRNMIGQYFLPFVAKFGIDLSSVHATAGSITAEIAATPLRLDMGPIFPIMPEAGSIVLPRPFIVIIFDQILSGRHSPLHLQARRRMETDQIASDAVIRACMDTLAASSSGPVPPPPFQTKRLRRDDFLQSPAHFEMQRLGFSQDEVTAALAPWDLVD